MAGDSRTSYDPQEEAMARLLTRFAIAFVVALGVTHAHAQPAEMNTGRYTMSPADNGFVRLDRRTGEMAFCQRLDRQWTCAPMDAPGMQPNQSGQVSEELAELRRENRKLRDEIARLDDRLGLNAPSAPRTTGPVPGLNLPSEAEVDRAIGYFGNILKKLKDQIEELKEEPKAAAPSEAPDEEKRL